MNHADSRLANYCDVSPDVLGTQSHIPVCALSGLLSTHCLTLRETTKTPTDSMIGLQIWRHQHRCTPVALCSCSLAFWSWRCHLSLKGKQVCRWLVLICGILICFWSFGSWLGLSGNGVSQSTLCMCPSVGPVLDHALAVRPVWLYQLLFHLWALKKRMPHTA